MKQYEILNNQLKMISGRAESMVLLNPATLQESAEQRKLLRQELKNLQIQIEVAIQELNALPSANGHTHV